MLKSIPKSNISRRSFKVYKRFVANQDDYTPLVASSSIDNVNNPLYRSIQKKYYTDNGLLDNYGTLQNPANFNIERAFSDNIYVIKLDQIKFGEKIKPGSLVLLTDDSTRLVDNGYGKITFPNPSYILTNIDIQEGFISISKDSVDYDLDILPDSLGDGIDFQNSTIYIYDSGQGRYEPYTIISMDIETGILILSSPLDLEGTDLSEISYGNVFYSDGIIVITATNDVSLDTFEIEYRATQTIHETEILIEAKAGEFNYSQNPSAVNVTLSGSYDFVTTAIPNVSPAKTVKIKEIQDISLRTSYSGTIGSVTGSWDDYSNLGSSDPTGSYLAPYITTIGIYDKDGDMVAVAKLPQPIKNLPDYDVNFIVRFDT